MAFAGGRVPPTTRAGWRRLWAFTAVWVLFTSTLFTGIFLELSGMRGVRYASAAVWLATLNGLTVIAGTYERRYYACHGPNATTTQARGSLYEGWQRAALVAAALVFGLTVVGRVYVRSHPTTPPYESYQTVFLFGDGLEAPPGYQRQRFTFTKGTCNASLCPPLQQDHVRIVYARHDGPSLSCPDVATWIRSGQLAAMQPTEPAPDAPRCTFSARIGGVQVRVDHVAHGPVRVLVTYPD